MKQKNSRTNSAGINAFHLQRSRNSIIFMKSLKVDDDDTIQGASRVNNGPSRPIFKCLTSAPGIGIHLWAQTAARPDTISDYDKCVFLIIPTYTWSEHHSPNWFHLLGCNKQMDLKLSVSVCLSFFLLKFENHGQPRKYRRAPLFIQTLESPFLSLFFSPGSTFRSQLRIHTHTCMPIKMKCMYVIYRPLLVIGFCWEQD